MITSNDVSTLVLHGSLNFRSHKPPKNCAMSLTHVIENPPSLKFDTDNRTLKLQTAGAGIDFLWSATGSFVARSYVNRTSSWFQSQLCDLSNNTLGDLRNKKMFKFRTP